MQQYATIYEFERDLQAGINCSDASGIISALVDQLRVCVCVCVFLNSFCRHKTTSLFHKFFFANRGGWGGEGGHLSLKQIVSGLRVRIACLEDWTECMHCNLLEAGMLTRSLQVPR